MQIESQEAIAWGEAMLREAEAIENSLLAGTALHLLGVAHQESSDLEKALPYFLNALVLRRESQDRDGIPETLYHLGLVYFELGDATQATEAMQQSLHLYEENGNTQGVLLALTHLGTFQAHQSNLPSALLSYERALSLARAEDAPIVRANLLNHIGTAQFAAKDYAKAKASFTEALALSSQLTTSLGDCFRASGEWDEALAAYLEAIRQFEEAGNLPGVAEAKLALASLYNQEAFPGHDPNRAITLLHKIQEAPVGLDLSCRVHREMAHALKTQGDFASALSHFEEFHALDKDLSEQASEKRLQSLQLLHDVAQAQKEAELEHLGQVELARANAELKRLSRQDELTGLLTRTALEERLTDSFATSQRYNTPLAVIFLDLDDFSTVNKTFGRAMGDEVLRVISRLLWSRCRETDAIGRYGGEEFCLILPHTDADGAKALGEELRQAIEGYEWERIQPGLTVTSSFGICSHTTQPDGEDMMEEAERHLHQAKEAGRNRVVS